MDVHDSNSGLMAFPRALAVRMLPFLPDGMAYYQSKILEFATVNMTPKPPLFVAAPPTSPPW